MAIPQNIRSVTTIEVKNIDLFEANSLVARVQQGQTLFEVPLTVVDAHKALLPLTRDQAEQLSYKKPVYIQILCENRDGTPRYSDKQTVTIDEIIGGVFGD